MAARVFVALSVALAAVGATPAAAAGVPAARAGVAAGFPVRCGDPLAATPGPGAVRAAEAFVVRDRLDGRVGVVQAVWIGRRSVQVRVCDERGLLRIDDSYVAVAGAPWRELQFSSRTCRLGDGVLSTAAASREPESLGARRARLRASVRRGEARVVRLGDGRHVVVGDGDLPVPTRATIGSRDWLAGC